MFKLTEGEWRGMFVQIARTSQESRRLDRLPLAFTEHGCLMLSNMLKSPRAVEVSVQIVKAFVELRTAIRANHDLALGLEILDKMLNRRIDKQDRKLATHERAILKILDDIRRLTKFPEPVRRGIGFLANLDKPED
jgi:hypothetical protein